jgi:hypothetical protein
VIGGGVNHGVWSGDYLPGSEFNGRGPFMKALNSPQGPDGLETTPGVAFMTLRSDSNDKFMQPDGRWIGQPKMATNASHDGPARKGAENVVLPGLDHRAVSYHPRLRADVPFIAAGCWHDSISRRRRRSCRWPHHGIPGGNQTNPPTPALPSRFLKRPPSPESA